MSYSLVVYFTRFSITIRILYAITCDIYVGAKFIFGITFLRWEYVPMICISRRVCIRPSVTYIIDPAEFGIYCFTQFLIAIIPFNFWNKLQSIAGCSVRQSIVVPPSPRD